MKALGFLSLVAWLFGGMLIEWHGAERRADVRVAKARAVGERNVIQAEDMLRACFQHTVFFVGSDIYRCRAVKSELTTAHFPELGKREAVF